MIEIKNILTNLHSTVFSFPFMATIKQYIVPCLVILLAIISMIVLANTYNKKPQMHLLRSREFVIHTIGSLLMISLVGMTILICGGLDCTIDIYEFLHKEIFVPLDKALPITTRLLTTIIGLLITFLLIHPRVAIYPLAAYEVINGKYWLTFQVRNMGLWECIDMKVDLYECYFQQREGVMNKVMQPIKLEPLAQSTMIDWYLGDSNDNTYLIEVNNNIFEKNVFKKSGHFLELRVKLTHPLSRITKVFVQDFTTSDIHYGEFIEYKLRRYANGDKHLQKNTLLKKDIMWRWTRGLKIVETILIAITCVADVAYIIINPTCEMTKDIATWLFYSLVFTTSVVEIARQYAKRPIESKVEDTNI